jgi:iron uptake system component EfeO
MRTRSLVLLPVLLPIALLASACGSDTAGSGADATSVTVTASDTECVIAPTSVPTGPVVFAVSNTGEQVTEVYVYGGADFTTVVSEVENIGPGVTRDMSADLQPGAYEIACKPGQTGDGIRADLTVTGEAAAGASATAAARELTATIDDTGVAESDPLTGTVGERIEFKVTNAATEPRVFEVKRPDGSVAGETEIAAGAEGELYIDVDVAGSWLVIVEGGPEETETEFVVTE